jgi:DNA-directed RNA polymerase subunit RPC12/RpoP
MNKSVELNVLDNEHSSQVLPLIAVASLAKDSLYCFAEAVLMTRPTVRCRCGHRVLAKEVLRTDLYERPSGREYVYVKYRCKRCKRLGETFVAESRWDWRIFEAARTEMSEAESEVFSDQAPISAEEILTFHCQLAEIDKASELGKTQASDATDEVPPEVTPVASSEALPSTPACGEITEQPAPENGPPKLRPEAKRDFKNEAKGENKGDPKQPSRDESTHGNHPQREN